VRPTPIVVGEPQRLQFGAAAEVLGMYLLSPYVWLDDTGEWLIALRAVPRSDRKADKIARVHLGRSDDGVHFTLDDTAALAPGSDDDRDGCEDPTFVVHDGVTHAFYSGWNEQHQRGQLLYATADRHHPLVKNGRVLSQPSRFINPKEASLLRGGDGWRLVFEYAIAGRSAVGMAASPSLGGPWEPQLDPFTRRRGKWDDFHLSPGPVVPWGEEQLMFYNGANDKTQWRIGWICFDATGTRVVARIEEPLITPPTVHGDDTDIAFCSSAVQSDGTSWLYYTVSDKEAFRIRIDHT
jgi:beta-1,2-mannobiose phosphorylase / 1,2-beta-oligomannan phosphorylase